MAYANDSSAGPAGSTDAASAGSKETMELIFFNMFNDRFTYNIGPTRQVLEEKYPGMLSDIIENLHNVSQYAAEMVHRQGLTFQELDQEAQEIFMNEFFRQIDSFADKVRESFESITPEQEQKLLEAYAKPRPTDN